LQEKSLDTDNLDFSFYDSLDNFSDLNFRDDDDSDPLKVDEFIHDNPKQYIDNHVSTIFTVRYHNQIIAFFTISMSSIGKKDMEFDDKINNKPFHSYPALLLGQIGVDKKYRGQGIGQSICKYCRGLGQQLNENVACAFLILQTTKGLAEQYYESKCDFKWKKSNKERVWMYRKLF